MFMFGLSANKVVASKEQVLYNAYCHKMMPVGVREMIRNGDGLASLAIKRAGLT